jgi:GntR family transcriptional regulator
VVTETAVIACELMDPPKPVAALLEAGVGSRVLRLVRVRSTEQGPVALLHNYVRADIAPGIEQQDFGVQSLFGVLEQTYRLKIASARRTFSAEPASDEVYLDDDRPVEYSDVWIHSGRLQVTSLLSRR